jgi:hypothetical protein
MPRLLPQESSRPAHALFDQSTADGMFWPTVITTALRRRHQDSDKLGSEETGTVHLDPLERVGPR